MKLPSISGTFRAWWWYRDSTKEYVFETEFSDFPREASINSRYPGKTIRAVLKSLADSDWLTYAESTSKRINIKKLKSKSATCVYPGASYEWEHVDEPATRKE